MNVKMPPSRLESMLKVAAPMHMAKKKAFSLRQER
jgi:hypothetical protein